MMVSRLFIFVFMIILASTVTLAQEEAEDPGVTPDSPLWGLDRALERIESLLAVGETSKARVELKHAHERLLEVKVMIEQNRLEHAERARIRHEENILRAKRRIRNIDANDRDAVEEEVELENNIEEEEANIEKVKRELKIRIKGSLTDEQQARVDELIDSFRNSTGEVKIEIRRKRDEIKIRIRQRTGRSDDDIEDEFEEHENRTGLNELRMDKAFEQIGDAEEELEDAREELEERFGNNTTIPQRAVSLLREAERHLENARLAFDEGRYGEAYGQATAAEHIAENILRRLEHEGELDEIRERRERDDEDEDDDHDDLEECIRKEKEDLEDREQFVDKNTLVVHYLDIGLKEGVIDLIESHGLEVQSSLQTIPGVTVDVTGKDGVRWLCILLEDPRIDLVDFALLSGAHGGSGGSGEIIGEGDTIADQLNVDLKGVIDYEGLPNPDDLQPIHGWKYFFIVDVEEEEKSARFGINPDEKITLLGDELKPFLEQADVRIKGTFIEDYATYKIARDMPITSADPEGQVILLSGLETTS